MSSGVESGVFDLEELCSDCEPPGTGLGFYANNQILSKLQNYELMNLLSQPIKTKSLNPNANHHVKTSRHT